MLRLPGEVAGEFEHAGGAGGVVVGAVMDLALFRRGHGELLAEAEVIVVGADDDVFVGLAGEIADDVGDFLDRALDVDGRSTVRVAGRAKDSGLRSWSMAAMRPARSLPVGLSHSLTISALIWTKGTPRKPLPTLRENFGDAVEIGHLVVDEEHALAPWNLALTALLANWACVV